MPNSQASFALYPVAYWQPQPRVILVGGLPPVSTARIAKVRYELDYIVRTTLAANADMDKSGSAAAFGSRLHKIFADAIRAARATTLPDVEVEQSFFDGNVVPYGDFSSKRTDVLLRQNGHVVAVWDFKTGLTPTMSESRKKSIRDAINSEYPNIPVDVIYVGYYYRMSIWGP